MGRVFLYAQLTRYRETGDRPRNTAEHSGAADGTGGGFGRLRGVPLTHANLRHIYWS